MNDTTIARLQESIDEYNKFHSTNLSPQEVLEEVFNKLMPKKEEPQCTCTEFQKQRALCPVCDKEEYDKMLIENQMLKQTKTT